MQRTARKAGRRAGRARSSAALRGVLLLRGLRTGLLLSLLLELATARPVAHAGEPDPTVQSMPAAKPPPAPPPPAGKAYAEPSPKRAPYARTKAAPKVEAPPPVQGPPSTTPSAGWYATPAPPAPPPTLTLTASWGERSLTVGPLDARKHQLAVRGALAVAPMSAPAGLAVIDARQGNVVRRIESPGAQDGGPPLGVALDGEHALFATEDGFVAKVRLDGVYAWIAHEDEPVRSAPVLADLDGDGVLDAIALTQAGVSARSGVNGERLWRTPLGCATEPRLRVGQGALGPELVVACAGGATLLAGASGEPASRPSLPDWQLRVAQGAPAIDAPERATCYLRSDAECVDAAQLGANEASQPGWEGALVGALFDGDRYGAIALGGDFAVAVVLGAAGEAQVQRAVLTAGSAPLELPAVRTLSSGDFDGDGRWDLLVATRDGELRAYSTRGVGRLYQGVPRGDLPLSGLPPSEWQTPRTYGSAGETAARFAPSDAVRTETFADVARGWSEPRAGAREGTSVSLFEDAATPRLALHWSGDVLRVPYQRRPQLWDAQANARGLFAHDQRALWLLAHGTERWASVPLRMPTALGARVIHALAVTERHVLIAYGEQLVVCGPDARGCMIHADASGADQAVRALAVDPDSGQVWTATADGQLFAYDPGSAQRSKAYSITALGSPSSLSVVFGRVIASGAGGTLVFPQQAEGALGAPAAARVELQEVVRCAADAPYYARSHGALLEASASLASWTAVRGQPGNVRALGCDDRGGLLVLSAEHGVYALPGPLAPMPFWQWALLLAACALALGWQVVESFRAVDAAPPELEAKAGVGLRSDQPLSRLPPDPRTHVKLRTLVQALLRFIDNADTQPPITLGVYGPWGSGKSSVMRALQHELEQKRRYLCVWFNPWRFHRESDIAVALLQSVVAEVRALSGLGRLRVALSSLWTTRTLVTASWLVPVLVLSAHMAFWSEQWSWLPVSDVLEALGLVDVSQELQGVTRELTAAFTGKSVLTLGGLGALGRVGWRVVKVFKLSPSALLAEGNHEKRVDFIRHFSDELRSVVDALPHAQRVVVFVDDLDRCPPDQVIALLEALNQLTESQRCYFVLGTDPRMVTCSVELHYKDLLDLKRERGEDVSGFGASYLEKIVTLAVHVPEVDVVELEQAAAAPAAAPNATTRLARLAAFGTQHATRLALGAWVGLWALGLGTFAYTASSRVESGSAAPSAAARAQTDHAQKAEPGATGALKPGAAQVPPTSSPGATGAATQPLAAANDAQAQPAQLAEALAPTSARPLHEAALVPPPLAPLRAEATSPQPADHAYAASVRGRFIVWLFGALCALTLLGLAVVLWLRRRQLGVVEPRAHDTPEFRDGLNDYLAHLPRNPRRLIRQGNAARFLYYLEQRTLEREHVDQKAFFATLLAEQCRSTFGDAVPFEERLLGVLTRKVPKSVPPEQEARVEQLYRSWPAPGPFEGTVPPPPVLVQELQGWLRDTSA